MEAKNIFKTLAFVMLMPAILLTTACSNINENEDTNKKGFTLPVTVNVTRQGDEVTTKATYTDNGNGTGVLSFSTGDKLFVIGEATAAGKFAGTLDWVSDGTFSGTITTENEYSGNANALFSDAYSTGYALALLLPADYDKYKYLTVKSGSSGKVYDDVVNSDNTNAIAPTKAEAIEQLSLEMAVYSYTNGFALSPQNAILNFTINGLTPGANVTATLTDGGLLTISGEVTTDGSGTATFAMGIDASVDPKNLNELDLTVGGYSIPITGSSTVVSAGKIYNVNRGAASAAPEGAINGKFTINAGGDRVYFSKGNLRASYSNSTWSWSFFPKQWGYVGDNSANYNITGDGTVNTNADYLYVDLFGWSTSATTYGIHNSQDNAAYGGDFVDWGNTIGTGWRTLTTDEWGFIFSTRTSGATVNGTSDARYTHATINTDGTGVNGMILFPDGVTIANGEATSWGTVNGNSAWDTKCTSDQWAALAAKGCVFLPAAGRRNGSYGTSVYSAGADGYYWSSSPVGTNSAYYVHFNSSDLRPLSYFSRCEGHSVRLVRAVE